MSFILCLLGASNFVLAQNSISGNIVDTDTNEPLVGVSIIIKGTVAGTITDASGNFTLNSKTTPPFTLVISSIGYQTQEVLFDGSNNSLSISLSEQTITGQEVVVSASKVEESILESPVTIEKMDLLAIRNSPSSNFYEALQNIKGVDMNTQSINFQAPNTRGFGGNANFRMLQLIDGVDNQGPGLAFSPGNLIGISEIDVESVELLPGASSVLYGPGAINGTLLINSKNPFQYQGFSGYAKVGVMHINSNAAPTSPMYDVGFRYAKAFNDRFAFKVNVGFVQALDWHAADYRNRATVNGAQFGTDETNQRN
ncbi:MAG TPA: TonB-dependent receptor, partial [Microscillaceae bacterium]|nr:TonB-dependent receptor [Microscillaceae bacterium]